MADVALWLGPYSQFILLGHWAFFLGVTLLSFLSLSFTLLLSCLLSCVTCFFLLSFFFVSWCHSQTCSTFTPYNDRAECGVTLLCFCLLGITLLFLVPGVTLLSFWMSRDIRNKAMPKKQRESKVKKLTFRLSISNLAVRKIEGKWQESSVTGRSAKAPRKRKGKEKPILTNHPTHRPARRPANPLARLAFRHCITLKNMHKWIKSHDIQEDMKAWHFVGLLWHRCADAVHEHGSTHVPLSASSQISLSRRPPWTESPSSILREQECRGGHCTRYSPSLVLSRDCSGKSQLAGLLCWKHCEWLRTNHGGNL